VTGYYSSSRRAAQTPCEDIQIRFPLPEPWIYLFRVERRFKYGSVHSATRKPGRIKGFERLTQLAQGILPPSLIEVSAGLAKYEHVFKAIVWRIDQLPERNEGTDGSTELCEVILILCRNYVKFMLSKHLLRALLNRSPFDAYSNRDIL